MWIDEATLTTIGDTEEHRSAEGTWYPGNFPKEEIPGLSHLAETAPPSFDSLTQAANELPAVQVDGLWTRQWEVVALSAETVVANLQTQIATAEAQFTTTLQMQALSNDALVAAGARTAIDRLLAQVQTLKDQMP